MPSGTNDAQQGDLQEVATGPRGGTTTRSDSGMVKKNLWVSAEVAETLRERAFRERRSEASIVREGLRMVLGLSDESEIAGGASR